MLTRPCLYYRGGVFVRAKTKETVVINELITWATKVLRAGVITTHINYTDKGDCMVTQQGPLLTSHCVDDNHKTLHSSAQSNEILAPPAMKEPNFSSRGRIVNSQRVGVISLRYTAFATSSSYRTMDFFKNPGWFELRPS